MIFFKYTSFGYNFICNACSFYVLVILVKIKVIIHLNRSFKITAQKNCPHV